MRHYDFFLDYELACKCGKCGQGWEKMDKDFMERLVAMRKEAGFPFHLVSAFRCPEHNNRVSSTGFTGPHTTGHSVDIALHGERAFWVIANAHRFGFTGIGVSQRGTRYKRFVHLDDLTLDDGAPRPTVWSY